MACKAYQDHRCGDCYYINRDAYRGTGKKVCYEIKRVNERKVAVEVKENQKSCGNFHVAKKVERIG